MTNKFRLPIEIGLYLLRYKLNCSFLIQTNLTLYFYVTFQRVISSCIYIQNSKFGRNKEMKINVH